MGLKNVSMKRAIWMVVQAQAPISAQKVEGCSVEGCSVNGYPDCISLLIRLIESKSMLTIPYSFYIAGIIVSIIFYGWLAFRRIEWSWRSFFATWFFALAWGIGLAYLAWGFDDSSRPTEFLIVQFWLAGVFLIPTHTKLLTWHLKKKIGWRKHAEDPRGKQG